MRYEPYILVDVRTARLMAFSVGAAIVTLSLWLYLFMYVLPRGAAINIELPEDA